MLLNSVAARSSRRPLIWPLCHCPHEVVMKWYWYFHFNLATLSRFWFQWSSGPWRGSEAARLPVLRVRIPRRKWMSLSCVWCVLSGSGSWDRPITRPEGFYRFWCVWVFVEPQQWWGLGPFRLSNHIRKLCLDLSYDALLGCDAVSVGA
jgi:hypothetical protein